MSEHRPSAAIDADFEEVSEQRRMDRRSADRRAARLKLDPMFAATLVNQIALRETQHGRSYEQPWRGPRSGIVVNVSA